MDYRVVLKNDEFELDKYNHYKALGYSDNQSFVLAVFTYGASRSMRYWMDVERNGLSMAMKHYDIQYADKGIKFCDYLTHLLSKTIVQYTEKERTESISCYLDMILCNYFGVGLQKADVAVTQYLRGFKGAMNVNANIPVQPIPPVEPFVNTNNSEIDDVFAEESEFNVGGWEAQSFSSSPSTDNAVFASPTPKGMNTRGGFLSGLMSKVGAPKGKVVSKSLLSNSMFNGSSPIEAIRTDSYEIIEEKGFLSPLTSPTSTFRMTCNTASMGVLKNAMKNGLPINKDMVRIEEMLNYFKYSLSKPTDRMFNINTEMCSKPDSNNKLLFIGVQGKRYVPTRQNIAFLLDVSGSMTGNVDATQLAFFTVLSKLKDNDILSLITYSSNDETIYEGKILNKEKDVDAIIERFLKINIYGCTNGSAGMETAYRIAKENYISNGVNRVILITDGDLNFGLTENNQLEKFISEKKETGVFLSVLGTGLGNYKDSKLEVLAKNGNGNYFVVNGIEDVQENIYNKYASLVFTIAKDVKAQVEFNPKFVKNYRLIGYENRELNHEDFKDDTVISEPFGSGSYAVALYELEMADGTEHSDLRYQKPIYTDSENLCTVSVRYKEPDGDESHQLFVNVKNKEGIMTKNLKLAYSIYAVGEKFRDSKYCPDISFLKKEFNAGSEFFIDMVKLNGKKMSLLYNLIKKLDVLEKVEEVNIVNESDTSRVVKNQEEVIDPNKLFRG